MGKLCFLTNIEYIPGKKITKHLGLVSGSTIRAKNVGADILASLKNIVGESSRVIRIYSIKVVRVCRPNETASKSTWSKRRNQCKVFY